MSDKTRTARRARPPAGAAVLQESVTESIRRAMLKELARHGYARMSMDAVARRAGAGKAALYRRWPSKQAMVSALISDIGVDLAEAPDTGSLRGDLAALVTSTHALLRHPLTSRILPDLHAEMVRDPDLARAVRSGVQERRRAKAAEVLERAISRGEIPPDTDIDIALDLLGSALYWRLIITRQPTGPGYLERLTSMLLAALGYCLP